MENQVQVFESKEFGKIRGLSVDGVAYVVGKEVAAALGYANPLKAVREHVAEEDKGVNKMITPGGTQKIICINESGVYSLILSSKLPAAKKFKRWVTSEVLPSLRRHGAYIEPSTLERMMADPDFMIRVFTELKKEKEMRIALQKETAQKTKEIERMKPKATYCDQILACKETVPVTLIAKDYGWSAMKMNRFLHDKGVIYRVGMTWVPYAAYQSKGYTKTRTIRAADGRAVINQEWTQEGRLFLYELMKQDGFLPLVEQKGEADA